MAEKKLFRQIQFQLEEETIRLLNKLVYWRSFPNKGQGLRPGSNPREVKMTLEDYYSPKQNHRDKSTMQNVHLSALNPNKYSKMIYHNRTESNSHFYPNFGIHPIGPSPSILMATES